MADLTPDRLGDLDDVALGQSALDLLHAIGTATLRLTFDAEIEETWTKPLDLAAIQYVPPVEEKE